jgi:hypothetical protein
LVDGRLDMASVAPLARLGYMDYADGGTDFRDCGARTCTVFEDQQSRSDRCSALKVSLAAFDQSGRGQVRRLKSRTLRATRSAWRRCGRSIIFPSSDNTPASGPGCRKQRQDADCALDVFRRRGESRC